MLSPTIDQTGLVPWSPDLSEYERFRAIVTAQETETLPSLGLVQAYADNLRSVLEDDAPAQLAAFDPFSLAGGVREGRTWHLRLTPGVVGLRSFDAARAEHTAARAVRRSESVLREVLGRSLIPGPDGPDGFQLRRDDELKPRIPYGAEVVMWSAKSRARMVERLASLDLSTWSDDGGSLAMVTLTLPGDWLAVAPTGREFKRHVERFRRRWVRAAGTSWRCIWKLEFQRRGAPHMHLLMRVPVLVKGQRFEDWLAETWADVVGADDVTCTLCASLYSDGSCGCSEPYTERAKHRQAGTGVDYSGGRYRDPRRISLYFLGHSTKHADGKEYQHIVPAEWQGRGRGPGRFWGYSGLRLASVEVELSQREAVVVRRLLRKVHGARTAQRDAVRAARGLPPLPRRRVRTLGAGGSMTGGWVLCNDALELAFDLGRYLAATTWASTSARSRLLAWSDDCRPGFFLDSAPVVLADRRADVLAARAERLGS